MLDKLNKEKIAELYPDEPILFADDFEDALIGITSFGRVLVWYDESKCIDIFERRNKTTFREAQKCFEVSVIGSYDPDRKPGWAAWFAVNPDIMSG